MRLEGLLGVARTSFRETLRAPVFGVALVLGVVATALSPALSTFTLGRAQAYALDLGTSTVGFTLLFLAAVSAGMGTSERLRDGTATLVLAGPTGRGTYLAGAWLGASAALVVAAWLLGLALVFAAGQAAGRRGIKLELLSAAFAGIAALAASRQGRAPGPAAWAALALSGTLVTGGRLAFEPRPYAGTLETLAIAQASLSALGALAYAALAVALATALPPAAAGASTLLASLAGAALPTFAGAATTARPLAVLAIALLPDLQVFSIVDAAYEGRAVPPGYLLQAGALALLHAGGALALATVVLDRRELG